MIDRHVPIPYSSLAGTMEFLEELSCKHPGMLEDTIKNLEPVTVGFCEEPLYTWHEVQFLRYYYLEYPQYTRLSEVRHAE